MKKINCHCQDVDFGTYKNTVKMIAPFELKTMFGDPKSSTVVIDTCIATAIGYLWHQGVKTLNSCCGHKKITPSVIVDKGSINKMLELGYKPVDFKCALPEQTFGI